MQAGFEAVMDEKSSFKFREKIKVVTKDTFESDYTYVVANFRVLLLSQVSSELPPLKSHLGHPFHLVK